LINSTSEKSILFPEDSQENFNLHCPSCAGEEFKVIPLSGKDGEYFVRVICYNCGEHLFFQSPYSLNSKIESDKVDGRNNLEDISYLQSQRPDVEARTVVGQPKQRRVDPVSKEDQPASMVPRKPC